MSVERPKSYVFVLMPFSEKFTDIYGVGIKAVCNELGLRCERVDEQIHSEMILARIYREIRAADIVLADMTGRNANVFFEVGFSLALEKRTVLLTQDANDIPFDLKQYHHVVYEGSISVLKEKLKHWLRTLLAAARPMPCLSASAVIDKSSTPMYFADTDGVIRHCNEALALFADSQRAEIENHTVKELFDVLAPRIPDEFREDAIRIQKERIGRIGARRSKMMQFFCPINNASLPDGNPFQGGLCDWQIHADRIEGDDGDLGWFVIYMLRKRGAGCLGES